MVICRGHQYVLEKNGFLEWESNLGIKARVVQRVKRQKKRNEEFHSHPKLKKAETNQHIRIQNGGIMVLRRRDLSNALAKDGFPEVSLHQKVAKVWLGGIMVFKIVYVSFALTVGRKVA